jgi:hypothetical protein
VWPLELADPALRDLVDGHWINKMELFATLALPGHETCPGKNPEVLCHGLSGHLKPLAEGAQRLAIVRMKSVQERPAAPIRQGSKHGVIVHATIM